MVQSEHTTVDLKKYTCRKKVRVDERKQLKLIQSTTDLLYADGVLKGLASVLDTKL